MPATGTQACYVEAEPGHDSVDTGVDHECELQVPTPADPAPQLLICRTRCPTCASRSSKSSGLCYPSHLPSNSSSTPSFYCQKRIRRIPDAQCVYRSYSVYTSRYLGSGSERSRAQSGVEIWSLLAFGAPAGVLFTLAFPQHHQQHTVSPPTFDASSRRNGPDPRARHGIPLGYLAQRG